MKNTLNTEGVWGFRYRNRDKLTKISNSIPLEFGQDVIKFCKMINLNEIFNIYKNIILVDPTEEPNDYDIEVTKNFIFDNYSTKDWDSLLKVCESDIYYYKDGLPYMNNYNELIRDSFNCAYGYIMNIDRFSLEVWKGSQKKPQKFNRYGTESLSGWYSCRLICAYPWKNIPKTFDELEVVENQYMTILGRY